MPDITRRTGLGFVAALMGATALPAHVLAQAQADGILPRTPAQAGDLSLWYKAAAKEWTEALPLGNGRLGVMVYGGVARERLQISEDTLYAGAPYQPANPDARAALPEVRQLIFDGKYLEAQELVQAKMMGTPIRQVSYQTVGEISLIFAASSNASDYRRELDLTRAVSTVTYRRDGVNYKRETFVSPIDQVMVTRLTADKPGRISFQLGFETPMNAKVSVEGPQEIVLSGRNSPHAGQEGALRYENRVRVVARGGQQSTGTDEIIVSSADEVLIYAAAATNYVNFRDVSGDPTAITRRQIEAAVTRPYGQMLADHIAAHQTLFNRVSVDFGRTKFADLPTNERIAKSQTQDDPALAMLYFQFGRYLLICCSRPGTQPANLQGIWNDRPS
ncbi:MAG: glycoside hydrolase family 95 protein, partial [Asticcacaulis sp.]